MSELALSIRGVPEPPLAGRLSSDERLARLVSRGSERAFATLYERHHQALYRYARSIVRDEEDARDALQSAMARAFAALRRSEREIAVRPWLFRIVHNESVSILRRRRPADRPVGEDEPSGFDVERSAQERERLTTLLADLHALPMRQRAALVMRELSGLSTAEIAQALATSPGAAKQSLFEARCSLQEIAEGRAMACESVRRSISERDGRLLRARRLRAHLRACPDCRAFQVAIAGRSADLRALAPPLPAAAAGTILAHLLAGGAAGPGGGAAAVGAGAGMAGGGAVGGGAGSAGVAAAGGVGGVGAAGAGLGGHLAGSLAVKVLAGTAILATAAGTARLTLDRNEPARTPVTSHGTLSRGAPSATGRAASSGVPGDAAGASGASGKSGGATAGTGGGATGANRSQPNAQGQSIGAAAPPVRTSSGSGTVGLSHHGHGAARKTPGHRSAHGGNRVRHGAGRQPTRGDARHSNGHRKAADGRHRDARGSDGEGHVPFTPARPTPAPSTDHGRDGGAEHGQTPPVQRTSGEETREPGQREDPALR